MATTLEKSKWDVPAIAILATPMAIGLGLAFGATAAFVVSVAAGPFETGDELRGLFVISVGLSALVMVPVSSYVLVRRHRTEGERLLPTAVATMLSPLSMLLVAVVVASVAS